MSIANFFRILWVRRNLILITTLSALAAAMLVISLVPARYTSTSRVMLDIVKPDPVTGQAMSSQFALAFVATQIELIKDYRVAGRVVDTFNWTGSPALAAAYSSSGADIDFRRWLAQRVIDGTEARLVPGSNILEISYTSDDPENAAVVADALRDAYVTETRLFRQRGAQRTAEWFSNQTRKLRGELTAAEKRKADFERENGVVINDDLSDSETSRLAALAGAQDAPLAPMMSASMPITSPSQAQLAQLDAAISNAMRTLGPNHPQIVAMRQQRAAVASSAAQELAAARAAARPVSVGGGGPSAASRFAAQQAKVLAQRGKVSEAQQLAIDVSVLREQVQTAAKRTAELQQEAESEETGVSNLGNAVSPTSPSFPNIPLLVIGAIALGLGLGAGISVLVELVYRKVRGPSDIELAGVPLLGVVHLFKPEQAKPSLSHRAMRLLPFGPRADA